MESNTNQKKNIIPAIRGGGKHQRIAAPFDLVEPSRHQHTIAATSDVRGARETWVATPQVSEYGVCVGNRWRSSRVNENMGEKCIHIEIKISDRDVVECALSCDNGISDP